LTKKRICVKKVLRLEPWEKSKQKSGQEGAKEIREEIERVSPFKLQLLGLFVENGFDATIKEKPEHLDYGVFYKGAKIAEIDSTRSNYTFDGSQFMPVSYYKGDIIKAIGVPAFLIYDMAKEDKHIKDRCVWIRGEDVINADNEWKYLGGKMQQNYFPDKKLWHRGLESLIEELLWIVDVNGRKSKAQQSSHERKQKVSRSSVE
jgi:hypothetical protein